MSTSGAAQLHARGASSASPASAAASPSSPERARASAGTRDDRDRPRPYELRPRGNPPLERADLERGEEKLNRVLGW